MSRHLNKPTNKTTRFPRVTLATLLVVATVILAIAAVALASRQRATATGASEEGKALQVDTKSNFVTVRVAGQNLQANSQTSQIKALTPEEARKLAAGLKQMVNQSTDGLVQVRHADGSVSMDLEGRFQNVTVARVNKDGSVSQSCVDNPQAAGAFFGIDPRLIEGKSNTTRTENQQIRKIVKTKR